MKNEKYEKNEHSNRMCTDKFYALSVCEKCASKETQTEEKSGMTTDTDGMAEYYGYYQIIGHYN